MTQNGQLGRITGARSALQPLEEKIIACTWGEAKTRHNSDIHAQNHPLTLHTSMARATDKIGEGDADLRFETAHAKMMSSSFTP